MKLAQIKSDKTKGLWALLADKRLCDAEKKRWLDLCADYHIKSETCKAMYAQRQGASHFAPDYLDYEKAHQAATIAERAMDEMAAEYNGFIAYPIQ